MMDKSLLEKINEIFDMEDMKKNVLTEAKLQSFEEELGIKLPLDYREYILKFPSLYIKDDYKVKMKECSEYTPKDGYDYVDYLYGSELITIGRKRMKFIEEEDKSDSFLPIGEAAGDMIMICVKGKEHGKVYMYYHESDEKDVPVFLIADSFEEFVKRFEFKPDNFDLSGVEVRLSPKLLESIKEFQNSRNKGK